MDNQAVLSRAKQLEAEAYRMEVEKKVQEELLQSSFLDTRKKAADKLVSIIQELETVTTSLRVTTEIIAHGN